MVVLESQLTDTGERGGDQMENVLTIAGSDSLAGGGIQADLKTFEELHTFGLSALTSVVSVLPDELKAFQLPAEVMATQLTSVFDQVPIKAVKTGLLGNLTALTLAVKCLRSSQISVVVDPVMVFKEGPLQVTPEYLTALKETLLPLATITTPNLLEAQQLSGLTITNREQMVAAARQIQALGCPNVVIKGGSRLGGSVAPDCLLIGDDVTWLEAPIILNAASDGAGCTFSAAITAQLAKGQELLEAVTFAKKFVHAAITHGVAISHDYGSVWPGGWHQVVTK